MRTVWLCAALALLLAAPAASAAPARRGMLAVAIKTKEKGNVSKPSGGVFVPVDPDGDGVTETADATASSIEQRWVYRKEYAEDGTLLAENSRFRLTGQLDVKDPATAELLPKKGRVYYSYADSDGYSVCFMVNAKGKVKNVYRTITDGNTPPCP